ncbi:MAG: type II toxin-antitoxin system RelE/ParE family toxin [Chloroflexota bacterium]|nr:type II toxin-antitoxin system RelE/ParE family toxin [Chloroflexota bacterium]
MSDRKRLLVITPEARSDIEQVLMYSEEVWGVAQSDRYEQSLYESLGRIRAFPDHGRPSNALLGGARSVICEHHVIYYTYDDDTVTIHRILHERQHMTPGMLLPEPEV